MQTDGTTTTQDNTSGKPEETSEQRITVAEAEERVRNAKSDILSETGRARDAAERATKTANEAVARLKEAEERSYQSDRDRFKDDPEKLSSLETSHRESIVNDKLAESEKKLSEANQRADTAEAENTKVMRRNRASEIAVRLNVSPELLGDLAMLTDGSVEAIEAKAKLLTPSGEPPAKEPILANTPRSSAPGTGRIPSQEELKASSPFETDKKIKSGEWVWR